MGVKRQKSQDTVSAESALKRTKIMMRGVVAEMTEQQDQSILASINYAFYMALHNRQQPDVHMLSDEDDN